MEGCTPAVVTQDQRVFPEGQPLLHDQGHAAMPRDLVMWKKPWFLSQGPMLGASCRRKMLTIDASLTGWGAISEGRSSQGLWKDHHLSWRINRLDMLAVFLALKNFLTDLRGHHVLVRSDNTSVVSYINHQGGLRSRPLCKLACQILLWSQRKLLSPQYRSRHPFETGAEARGMEAPPRGGGADVEGVRPGTSGSVCVSRDVSLPTLVLPHASSSSRTGCDDTDVAEASSVRISPDRSAPGSTGESSPGPGPTTSYCPAVAGQSMVPKSFSLLDGPPLELPVRRDLLSQAGGSIFHPHPELWKLWAWPLRGPSS